TNYILRAFEPSFEEEQDRIEIELGKNQPWFSIGLRSYFTDPIFDPETIILCFKEENMVGFLRAKLTNEGPAVMVHERPSGYIQIPSVLPGNEGVDDLLMEKIIGVMKAKGVKFIQTRVSTMWENSIQLAEKWGFKPLKDFLLGYKKYYNLDLKNGSVNYPITSIQAFDNERDLSECAENVASFFNMPIKSAKKWILEVDGREDLVSHLVIRDNDGLAGYCFAFPNPLNQEVVATYYIEASTEEYLKQLLVQTIENCIAKKYRFFLIDLLKDLLRYENTVIALGLKEAAVFGIYELEL
ncbi:MAG: hypothetical protein ACW991_10025, partial [Candidatus Hodarchaeales archaeon]